MDRIGRITSKAKSIDTEVTENDGGHGVNLGWSVSLNEVRFF
jgi:hypothetical protein